MKFPLSDGQIATMHADQKEARQCYVNSLKEDKGRDRPKSSYMIELDPRGESDFRPVPVDDIKNVEVRGPGKNVRIGTQLPQPSEQSLTKVLLANADLFAWSPEDMPGIDLKVACHKLAIEPGARPIAQCKRKIAGEKKQAVREETSKLLKAGFIKEIKYPTWLSNVVLVKKSNGKWRMCTDFTDLNKVCPKDPYPLPSIDALVDGTSGYQVLSFMDAYSGYNQIRMHPLDAPKTAFMTETSNFYNITMPFGLKNTGSTYQRMMDEVFAEQIGKTIEVYMDDMVVKTSSFDAHYRDLQEVFDIMRKYNIRLNPEKCSFGVLGGKFLGFMITHRGIEANPDKCRAVMEMRSPSSIKEVQRLAGRIAALSRFVTRFADKSFPFYQVLRKPARFEWTEECETAFRKLKEFLASPPVLTRPSKGAHLLLYLAATDTSISSAIVEERSSEQHPVYFVSKVLHRAELRYQKVEKLALLIVISARRLRPYFQAHPVIVKTDYPIKKILQKPELSGRMWPGRWSSPSFKSGMNLEDPLSHQF